MTLASAEKETVWSNSMKVVNTLHEANATSPFSVFYSIGFSEDKE